VPLAVWPAAPVNVALLPWGKLVKASVVPKSAVNFNVDADADHDILVPLKTQISALGGLAKFWMVAVGPCASCEMTTRQGTPLEPTDPQVGVQVFVEHAPGAPIAELTHTASSKQGRPAFLQTERLNFMAAPIVWLRPGTSPFLAATIAGSENRTAIPQAPAHAQCLRSNSQPSPPGRSLQGPDYGCR
jgi:hypothetical protein